MFTQSETSAGSLATIQVGGFDIKKIQEKITNKGLNKKGGKRSRTAVDDQESDWNPYRPPAEEDMYIPPGRKRFDRDELRPSEDEIKLGPPIVEN